MGAGLRRSYDGSGIEDAVTGTVWDGVDPKPYARGRYRTRYQWGEWSGWSAWSNSVDLTPLSC